MRFLAHEDVFSAAHANQFGITSSALRRQVLAGAAHPLHRGWYCVRPPRDAADHHALRTTALLQEYEGLAVASHGSAVLRLGLPTERVDFGTVHLMWVGPDVAFRSYSRVRMHEAITHAELPHRNGAVHPALAVVQAGLLDVRSMLVAGDAALRRQLVDAGQLRTAARALHGQRGLIPARAALRWCDGRHESPGETLTAYLLRGLGYELEPQFAPGTKGPGGGLHHADFKIKGEPILVEFDGKEKYAAASPEEAQLLLFAEKKREDGFRGIGYEVVRVSWADLFAPARVRRRLDAASGRARLKAS